MNKVLNRVNLLIVSIPLRVFISQPHALSHMPAFQFPDGYSVGFRRLNHVEFIPEPQHLWKISEDLINMGIIADHDTS